MLRIIRSTDQKALDRLLGARASRLDAAEPVARRIVADVRRHGDRALIRHTRQLDGVDLRKAGFTVEAKEINEAYRLVSPGFVEALRVAERNIRAAATAD
ncbi:MAG TPA: histidinol dehydrogenase, partial [Terriglobia bacterium]|nr:histidinol dehydrogenase [Terriglobia bacterium]